MERSRRTELKKYFGEMREPVAIVDKDLKCVYSNRPKLLPENASIEGVFCGDTKGLLYDPKAKPAVIDGCSYSVRVTPIDEGLYVCEFFDSSSVFALAENTDLYSRIYPMTDVIERNVAELWRGFSTLEETLQGDNPDALKIAMDMKKRVVELNSCSKNISVYTRMLKFTPRGIEPINLAPLARSVAERCNTALSNLGRCVDFVCEENEIYINAHQYHVVCALVNAIQNALMYSTRDCVPCLTLSKREDADGGKAVIALVNNSSLYINSDEPSVNLAGQRVGYGIPIIKRFAELSGGTFELSEENGTFTALIELPLLSETVLRNMGHQLSSGGYEYYKTGIPDIVELKMLEIISLLDA